MAVSNFDLAVYNEDGSQICNFPMVTTSDVEVYGDIKSSKLILKVFTDYGITIDSTDIYISDTTSNFQELTITPTSNIEGYVNIPDSLLGKNPLYLSDNNGYRYGEFANKIPSKNIIQIDCSTSNASIYYTLDGNVPSESSILYENQIEVEPGTIIKAIGIKEGWIESDTASLEIKQTLPTPEIELQGTSRFLFLTNYDEFPASTEFYVSTYNNDGTIQTFENEKAIIQDSGQVITESETLIAMWSGYATLLAKCEGYEDSLGTTQQ